MARYIDADKVMEKISHITVTVMGGRSYEKTIFGKALNSYREEVLKRIEDAPTADVVPKSEVERLEREVAILNEKNAGLALACFCDCMANEDCLGHNEWKAIKAEVAREIFEEIENITARGNSAAEFWDNWFCKYAELKNKYLEEKE